MTNPSDLPNDVDALKRIIQDMARSAIAARVEIEKLRFELARLKRARFGRSSEQLGSAIAQLELAIETLEEDQAERLAAGAPAVAAVVESAKPARRPLPAHLPREEVVHAAPCACPACWPTSSSPSTTIICRCIARPRSTPATASPWRPRP